MQDSKSSSCRRAEDNIINAQNKIDDLIIERQPLEKKLINLENLNLLVEEKNFDKEILVKVRSTGKLLKANIDIHNSNTADVNLVNSEDGISPGQACVFYQKDNIGYKVLGGGWIRT